MSRRSQALAIVSSVVPSIYGDAKFSRIIDGLYTAGDGAGTTCGFLASYLLFQLGCRAPEIVNRTDAASGLKYEIGGNISRLVSGAKALGAWRTGAAGIKPGDIYFISNGPPLTEHVGVYISGDAAHWTTADAGQRGPNGEQAAKTQVRAFDGENLGTLNGPKTIQGYVDIDALPLTAWRDDGVIWALLALAALWWIW